MTQTRIEQIQKEIEKLKRARLDTDVDFTLEAIDEEIEVYEKELCKLVDEQDEETDIRDLPHNLQAELNDSQK